MRVGGAWRAMLRCSITRPRWAWFGRDPALSYDQRQLIEGGTKTLPGRLFAGDLVVTAPQVLDESMTSSKNASRLNRLSPRIGRRRSLSRPSPPVRRDPSPTFVMYAGTVGGHRSVLEAPRTGLGARIVPLTSYSYRGAPLPNDLIAVVSRAGRCYRRLRAPCGDSRERHGRPVAPATG
jgi:hypothetical protein